MTNNQQVRTPPIVSLKDALEEYLLHVELFGTEPIDYRNNNREEIEELEAELRDQIRNSLLLILEDLQLLGYF